jgi:hypothetical protein
MRPTNGRGAVTRLDLSNRERAKQAAAAYWYTYRNRLAEMIGVSQLAIINDDFAQYWAEICALPISFITETARHAQAEGYCAADDAQPVAVAIVAMFNQSRYVQLSGIVTVGAPDDDACIQTLANMFYRAIYAKEVC